MKQLPFRKHIWEIVPEYILFTSLERCKTCCVLRNSKSENEFCLNPRDKKYRAWPDGIPR